MHTLYNSRNDKKIAFITLVLLISAEIIWIALIVTAPLIIGREGIQGKTGILIYGFFSPLCHQLDDRCFHIAGYKFAVCARCFSIYSGFLLGTILYPLFYRKNFLKMPGLHFLAAATVIIILDVLLDYSDILKNSFLSRSLSGGLAGLITAFFIVPGLMIFVLEIYKYIKDYNN